MSRLWLDLSPPAKDDYDGFATPDEVETISGSVADAQFADTLAD